MPKYFSILLPLWICCLSATAQDVMTYMQKADSLFRTQHYQPALDNARKALQIDSANSGIYTFIGVVYSTIKDHEQAATNYTKAIQLDTTNHYAWYNRGQEKKLLEDIDGMCTDFGKTEKLLQRNVSPEQLKEVQTALAEFCDSSKASYYYQRGIAYYNLKQYKQSIAMYEKGLKKFPGNAKLHDFKGNTWVALKDYAKALTAYEQAARNFDNYFTDIIKEAIVSADMDLLRAEAFTDLQYRTATCQALLGKNKDALVTLNRAIQLIETKGLSETGKEKIYQLQKDVLKKIE